MQARPINCQQSRLTGVENLNARLALKKTMVKACIKHELLINKGLITPLTVNQLSLICLTTALSPINNW